MARMQDAAVGFQIEPPGKRPRPITTGEFEREVSYCVLEVAGVTEKHGHVWLHSLWLAYDGWNWAAIAAFERKVFARLGISANRDLH